MQFQHPLLRGTIAILLTFPLAGAGSIGHANRAVIKRYD
jgi:hypothetical protein